MATARATSASAAKATAQHSAAPSPCEKHWIGSHLSTAGSLRAAIDEAVAFRFGAAQIFTRNQRQWTPKSLTDAEVADFTAARQGTVFEDTRRIVSHNSYLVNLASPDAENLKKSILCERAELERCERLGVCVSVAHPGAHLCASGGKARKPADPNDLDAQPSIDELDGLDRLTVELSQASTDHRQFT